MEKIEKNLKLLGEDLNIQRIHAKIRDYLKSINKEAKNIFSGMKEQVNILNRRHALPHSISPLPFRINSTSDNS